MTSGGIVGAPAALPADWALVAGYLVGPGADLAGADYRGLLVFAYLLHPSIELAADTPDLFAFRGKRYLFRAIGPNAGWSDGYRDMVLRILEHVPGRSRFWRPPSSR